MSSGKRKNEKMECEGSRKSSRLIAIDEAKAALELEKKTTKSKNAEFWKFMQMSFDDLYDFPPNNITEDDDYVNGKNGAKQILESGGAITFISDKCPINLQISNTLKINMNYMYGFVKYLKEKIPYLDLDLKEVSKRIYTYTLKGDGNNNIKTFYAPDKNYEDFYKSLAEAEAEAAEAVAKATAVAAKAKATDEVDSYEPKYDFLLSKINQSDSTFNTLVNYIKTDVDKEGKMGILETITHSYGRIENIVNIDKLMEYIKGKTALIIYNTTVDKIGIIKGLAEQITLYDELDKLSEKISTCSITETETTKGGRGGKGGKVGKEKNEAEKQKEKNRKEAEKLKEKKLKEAEKLKEKKMKEAEKLKEKKMKEKEKKMKEKEKKMKEKEKKMKEKEKKMKEKENNTKKKIKNKISP